MKQYLLLGVVAAGLFAVSAAMSVWLNRAGTTTDEKSAGETAAGKKSGGKDAEPADKHEKADKTEKAAHRAAPKEAHGSELNVSPSAGIAAVRDREDRLDRRQAQIDLILRDLQAEREGVDALMREVTAEAKLAAGRPAAPEPPPATPKQEAAVAAAADQKAVDKLADLYNAMPAESAAPILKQMADSGQLDTTVRIIAKMKDRQAAQVLAAMADPSLAGQITERVRLLRRTEAPTLPPLAPLPSPPRRGTP